MAGKKLGDMTPQERERVVRQTVMQFQRELDRTAPMLTKLMNEPLDTRRSTR